MNKFATLIFLGLLLILLHFSARPTRRASAASAPAPARYPSSQALATESSLSVANQSRLDIP